MSVQGISGGAGGIGYPIERPAGRREETQPTAPEALRDGAAVQREAAAGAAAARGALSSEPPPGTDPALWSVLTTEERAYYARVQSMGPLTYRPGAGGAASTPPVRGGRLDVRA